MAKKAEKDEIDLSEIGATDEERDEALEILAEMRDKREAAAKKGKKRTDSGGGGAGG